MSNQPSKKPKDEINENLFSCHHECDICCFGCWCAPCLFGRNIKRTDHTDYVSMCCLYAVLSGCFLCGIPHKTGRLNLRKKYNLKEDPHGDLLTVMCCSPCALCQEAREIKWRDRENLNAAKETGVTPVVSQPRGLLVVPPSEKTPSNDERILKRTFILFSLYFIIFISSIKIFI